MGITFSDSSNSDQYGYHILRVQPNSPAQQAGLQPFFDFIVSINGHSISSEPHRLTWELSSHRDGQQPVELSVYNSKLCRLRHVTVTPRADWGGQGLLGASGRLCTAAAGGPANAWRVLDVSPGSPAGLAGLRPGTDYLLGAEAAPLHTADDLFDLIESRIGQATRLYVYCSRLDACREVTVTPDPGWGGEGCLGCGIGYGYLHRIPDGGGVATEPADQLDPKLPSAAPESPAKSSSSASSVSVV